MNNNEIFKTEQLLDECKTSRQGMSKKECIRVSSLPNPMSKDYLINFANCCYNRMLDIFDDTLLLLENNRIQAACTISRAMIETQAFLIFTIDKVKEVAEKKDVSRENIINTILASINSSRIKVEEQKKVKDGKLKIDDYSFTPEARKRMLNMEAINTHVMDALRNLYKHDIEDGCTTDLKDEAYNEQLYNILSEWVHPSQTSLFTQYVKENHNVPTSLGTINFIELSKYHCIQALLSICILEENYNIITKIADNLPA